MQHYLKQRLIQYYFRIWKYFNHQYEPIFVTYNELSLLNNSNNNVQGQQLNVEDIIEKFRIAWGVPKIRTCQAKKVTRKFDRFRTLELKKHLVVCQTCGSYHHYNRICAACYEKVHELTNFMKSKIMAYNPYIGEKQSTNVKFEDDPRAGFSRGQQSIANDDTSGAGSSTDRTNRNRIVELGIPRPSWFKPKFIDDNRR